VDVVIMTGGKGMRMKPYTKVLPKGLLPVGEQPILEILVRQLCTCGFDSITMACGYLAPLIQAYFGDGQKWGVDIRYAVESQPLGTAGALRTLSRFKDPFLVLNCDVLTTLKFRDLYEFHCQNQGVLTVASQRRDIPIHLGVLETAGLQVVGLLEKPISSVCVSMGIYVMDPTVVDYIPDNMAFDMPDLVHQLLQHQCCVCHYDNDSDWLDIGRPEDYVKANEDFASSGNKFISGDLS
jgi:NDP-mannose synthase